MGNTLKLFIVDLKFKFNCVISLFAKSGNFAYKEECANQETFYKIGSFVVSLGRMVNIERDIGGESLSVGAKSLNQKKKKKSHPKYKVYLKK